MTPEETADKIMRGVSLIEAFDGARRNEFTSTFTVTSERYKTRAELHAEIAAAIHEAERLALERAAKICRDRAEADNESYRDEVDWRQPYARHRVVRASLDNAAEIEKALSQPETPATPSTDEEVRAWCERIYCEGGVTQELRRAYEFYKANYRGETPT
jgi:hypothetical protein